MEEQEKRGKSQFTWQVMDGDQTPFKKSPTCY